MKTEVVVTIHLPEPVRIINARALYWWLLLPRAPHVPKRHQWHARPWECLSRRERRRMRHAGRTG
jgi:hypothetical protein